MNSLRLSFLFAFLAITTSAACSVSGTESPSAPAAPAKASSDGGTTEQPRGDAGPSAETLEDGPTAHLFTDVKISWQDGPNGMERNCKQACAAKKLECRDDTTVRFSEISSNAVGIQVLEPFSGGANHTIELDCEKNTTDSYNDHGKGYMPLRTDCTCYGATKLVKSTEVKTCSAICKSAGLACDDTVYWPVEEDNGLGGLGDGTTESPPTGGGRARYGSDQISFFRTVACNEVPKKWEWGENGSNGLPPNQIACACH